jgi:hypothetical protein
MNVVWFIKGAEVIKLTLNRILLGWVSQQEVL